MFATIIDLYKKITSWPIISKLPFYALIVFVIWYIFVLSFASIVAHLNFSTGTHDAGVYDKIIWSLSRFRAPISAGGDNLFAFHVSFYCIFLAPLFWLWPNIKILFIAQSVFLALGAIPLFLYAKERLGNSLVALAVGFSFLMYPALHNMNLDNFHPEVFTVFFLIVAIYFLLKERYRLFYPFLFLSALGKEDLGLYIIAIGLFLLLFKKNLRHGMIVIGFGLFWHLFCFKFVFPLANGILFSSNQPTSYSHWFGGLVHNLFNPNYYWQSFFHPDAYKYYFALFRPVLFIPLLSPPMMFMLLPQMSLNILSRVGYLRSIDYHYTYAIICFMFYGLIEGLALVNRIRIKWQWVKHGILLVLAFLLVFSAVDSRRKFSKLPTWKVLQSEYERSQVKWGKEKREALKLIPREGGVSASYSLFPHLSHRKEIFMFPNPFQAHYWTEGIPRPPALERVDFVVIEWSNHSGDEERRIINYLRNSDFYEELYRELGLLILKRKEVERPSNRGVNYIVYDLKENISLEDNFSKKLKVESTGTLSMLYFPRSRDEFKNLLGEEIVVGKTLAIEFFGYLFIPDPGIYHFDLRSFAKASFEINGKAVDEGVVLDRGFYRYKLKYLNDGQDYDLRLVVNPPKGEGYIIPDRDLRLEYLPIQLQKELYSYEKKKQEQEAIQRAQPNLVKNGGFEDVLGHVPNNWRLEHWEQKGAICSNGVDQETKKSGARALKIQHRGFGLSHWIQEVEVKPRTNYEFSAWIKTDGISRRGTGAYLKTAGEFMDLRTDIFYGTRDWFKVGYNLRTSKDQNQLSVICRLGDYGTVNENEGTVYFDQIELKEVP